MANKKYDIYHIQGAFNWADVQIDREWEMKEVRGRLNDVKAEVDWWDHWTSEQKKKYKNGDKDVQ